MGRLGFWVAAAAMLIMVGLTLAQALRRGRAEALGAPGAEDAAVYRDQLTEVARDLARGTLAPAEAERLQTEISRRLLATEARRTAATPAPRPLPLVLALAVVLLALAGAAAIYARLGVPDYPDLPLQRRLQLAEQAYRDRPSQAADEAAAPKLDGAPAVDPQMAKLIDQLRQAVKDHPDDLKGLQLLSKYEGMLGNFAAAVAAERHLIDLKGAQATAEDHAGLAELLILAAGGAVSAEAEAQLVATLTKDPRNAPARYYSGLMFLQVGRPDRTFEMWEPLLREGPADAPWIGPIRDQIEEVASSAGLRYALPEAKGPAAADMAAAADMTPEARQAMIEGMVGGLESRLLSEGGTLEDWTKLIRSLGILGQVPRATAAWQAAKTAFAADPGALAGLRAAAVAAGVTP